MKLTDRHTDKMTMQALDEGDALGLHVEYDASADGVLASLGITLDEYAQEHLLREWVAIRLYQQGLGALARELRVPVLALSQLSRAVEQRTPHIPQLSDLRESGALEQDADVVLFIYRDEKYNPDTDKKGVADIIVAKHRNGPTGQVQLLFLERTTKFLDLEVYRS